MKVWHTWLLEMCIGIISYLYCVVCVSLYINYWAPDPPVNGMIVILTWWHFPASSLMSSEHQTNHMTHHWKDTHECISFKNRSYICLHSKIEVMCACQSKKDIMGWLSKMKSSQWFKECIVLPLKMCQAMLSCHPMIGCQYYTIKN